MKPICRDAGTTLLEREALKPLKIQRQYVAAQNHFDKKEYHDVLGILNKLLDVHKDPRHYALLGATLLKLKMKTEAAQAFQLAGGMESPHKIKYMREAMRLHFSNNDDINVLRLGARILKEAIADPDMAVLMSGALMRQELDGAEAFRNTLARSDEPTHRQLAARSIRLQDRSDEENKCILEIFEKDPEDRIVRNFYLSAMRDALDYDIIRKYEPINSRKSPGANSKRSPTRCRSSIYAGATMKRRTPSRVPEWARESPKTPPRKGTTCRTAGAASCA
ncbi:hypothetical protein LZK73_04375 [Neorhizobium galegae]|nr:hypothetical protein LZK73_04375 [Neorhizobium galegae]